ncbi:hypothetical protein niasHT_024716 [Heterodera trifolii]|uniref:Fido domain-containing protein n=1 Tax=Heterodera trifolii TaxID=157864 RepID=A0ABD2KHR1_9BILA
MAFKMRRLRFLFRCSSSFSYSSHFCPNVCLFIWRLLLLLLCLLRYRQNLFLLLFRIVDFCQLFWSVQKFVGDFFGIIDMVPIISHPSIKLPSSAVAQCEQRGKAYVHPYLDGNGRVCRLVANWILSKARLNMFSVPEKRRDDYNAGLDLTVRARREGHATGLDANINRSGAPDWLRPFIAIIYLQMQNAQQENVYVHPYMDGNGRVCKLVANWILSKGRFRIFSLPERARDEYNAGLGLAVRGRSEGHIEPTNKFFRDNESMLEKIEKMAHQTPPDRCFLMMHSF